MILKAVRTKVQSGLATDPGFKRTMQQHNDNPLTQLVLFGHVGLNNAAKAMGRRARQVLDFIL
jgi:hypothetical protein